MHPITVQHLHDPLRFRIILLISLLLLFWPGKLKSQVPDIREDLEKLNIANTNEKLYLHSDCEVYAPGDTIWFSAYLRTQYSLKKSYLSKLVHVNLVNENREIVKHEKFLVDNAHAPGYMVIDNKQADGYYSLMAYSSWMKNFDPEYIFKKKIIIVRDINKGKRIVPVFDKASYSPGDTMRIMVSFFDDLNNPLDGSRFRYRLIAGKEVLDRGGAHSESTHTNPLEFPLPTSFETNPVLELWNEFSDADYQVPLNKEIIVNFFPEGGVCLDDQMGLMAFKANYSNGRPAKIGGVVIDEDGNVYDSVKTEHQGMGKFLFIPRKDKSFFLRVSSPRVEENLFKLPEGKTEAWTIKTNYYQDKLHVELKSNVTEFDTLLFAMTMRGYNDYFRWIRSPEETSFTIPAAGFPGGIAVLTLLDKNWLPISERLVFLNQDYFLIPEMSSNRKKYLCRDSVILDIQVDSSRFNPKGQYSLSVFDAEFGSSKLLDEPNIITASYLKPEIKGEIAEPNYYFEASDNLRKYHLDLLMLTQGWRTYNYEKYIVRGDSIIYPRDRDAIEGTIKRFRFGREPAPTEADIDVYFSGSWVSLSSDDKGFFSISPQYEAAHISPVVISAKDKNGSEKIIISTNEESYQDSLKAYLKTLSDSAMTNTGGNTYIFEDIKRNLDINASKSIWIEEVEVRRNVKPDSIDIEEKLVKSLFNVRQASEGVLTTANELKDIVMSLGMNCYVDLDSGQLMIYYQGNYEAVRFIIDGFDMGDQYMEINAMYLPTDIENLYVARGFDAALMYHSTAIVYIKTKFGAGNFNYAESVIKNYITIPVVKVNKEFYSPAYRTEEQRNDPVPDVRKTIFWNPDIEIDSSGKARIIFFNSDRYTRVNCILEGFTDEGIPVHAKSSYDITIYRE